jgi:hypothetical protein
MKKSHDNLHTYLNDIRALLDLSLTLDSIEQRRVIFRSAVVLLIASWEQYVEQLAESSIAVLTDRLGDSTTLPENVKQRIALFSVSEKRNNQREFSDCVWMFADKGWKIAYIGYCKNLTSNLHTASPINVKELYWSILGIRDIASGWHFHEFAAEGCVEKLKDLVDLRHDIAHGANARDDELIEENIREQTEFIGSIAKDTYRTIFDCTAELSQAQALGYSLAASYVSAIVSFAARKVDRILTLDEIRSLGSSAQGNHNKLCYEPWSLLEFVNRTTRRIPDRLLQFHNDEISLPLEIIVFDNNEAIEKPRTRQVAFSELSETYPYMRASTASQRG